MRLPISVAFPRVTEIDIKDGELRLNNDKQDFYILKSLLLPYLLEINKNIEHLINTFLTFDENNIKESIGIVKESAKKTVKLKEPRLLKDRQYDEVEAAIISESCIQRLLSSNYDVDDLPENIYEIVNKAILNPYDIPVRDLARAFITIDNKNNTMIHLVSKEVLEATLNYPELKGSAIEHDAVTNYFIKVDDGTVAKILTRIQEIRDRRQGNGD
jgi:hypothetical protein